MNIAYIPQSYRDYISERPFLLTQNIIKQAIQITSGILIVDNQTLVTEQDYFLTMIDSTLSINGMTLRNWDLTTDVLSIIQSTVSIASMTIEQVNTLPDLNILAVSNSDLTIAGLTYTQSNARFLLSSYSSLTITGMTVNRITEITQILSLRSDKIKKF